MDEQKPIPADLRSTEPETPTVSRGISPGTGGARSGGLARRGQSRPVKTDPQRVENVLRMAPVEAQQSEPPKPVAEVAPKPTSAPPTATEPVETAPMGDGKLERREGEPQQIPARMLNEFVYCQRLFYYEFVEGVFVESADTLRGGAIHQRVDSGNGTLPAAKKKPKTEKTTTEDLPAATVDAPTKESE